MANFSPNIGLELPVSIEHYDINVFNKNAMIVDSKLNQLDLKNKSQDNLLATKEELNAEITRATSFENNISNNLTNEINRATTSETQINNNLSSHISDETNPHNVSKSQIGLGNVEDKSSTTIRSEITKSDVTNALGYTPYTPNEVDNKLSALETNIDWKESVSTFDDIATIYPEPQDGWTVNVNDTDYTYRYNGTSWIPISANAIPKATNSVDGLLSMEDYAKYEDANSKKHIHTNKSVLDGITSALITAWNNAVEHITDTIKHITFEERTNWNAAKTHADSQHARVDATKVENSNINGNIKINGTETNVYVHPSGTNPHNTTKSDIGLENVENKSSSTIRSELTKENITNALGYTPDDQDNDFILINKQTITFTNNVCTISDNRITSDSLADVYFTSDTISIAENADISVETYNGNVKLTAINSPTGTIKATIQIRVV